MIQIHPFSRQMEAFTLIELLIVVAIIAILSAIAVPNFLEAQTRVKVSYTMSDIRATATAMESYRIEYNYYPIIHICRSVHEFLRWRQTNGVEHGIGSRLTTPVAYISSIPGDVFNTASIKSSQKPHNYGYNNMAWASFFYRGLTPMEIARGAGHAGAGLNERHFDYIEYAWSFESAGPDITPYPQNSFIPFYDPTNGTISSGDIWYFNTAGFRGGPKQ